MQKFVRAVRGIGSQLHPLTRVMLADRGYCTAKSIAHAVAEKADVLIRFRFTPIPLLVDEKGTALDLRRAVLAIKRAGTIMEWTVFVSDKGAPIRCRSLAHLKRCHARTREGCIDRFSRLLGVKDG